MKKFFFLLTTLLVGFSLSSCINNPSSNSQTNTAIAKNNSTFARIKIIADNQEIIVRLHDNPASQDLLTLLPLTLTFSDYIQAEKIAKLPRKLSTQSMSTNNLQRDDFAYFAPWGNLAIFYKGKGEPYNGLIFLGTIESGKNVLSNLNGDFVATIERVS